MLTHPLIAYSLLSSRLTCTWSTCRFTSQQVWASWDIAKRYRTTVENIMEINALTSDSIKPDDRLIIATEFSTFYIMI